MVYEPNTSSYHAIEPICRLFPEQVHSCSIDEFSEIDDNKYNRIIFRFRKELQNWRKVGKPINNDKYIFFSSNSSDTFPFKTASNGFTEYINGKQKYFLPICSVLDMDRINNTKSHYSMGFYADKQVYDSEEKRHIYEAMKAITDIPVYELHS